MVDSADGLEAVTEWFGVGWRAIVGYGRIHLECEPFVGQEALDVLVARGQQPFWEAAYQGIDQTTGMESWSIERRGHHLLEDMLGLGGRQKKMAGKLAQSQIME